MSARSPYPGIERATVAMAYDNGCINRDRSEAALLVALNLWLIEEAETEFGMTPERLGEIDVWLARLSDEDLHIVVAGEDTEQETALTGAPPQTDLLLTWVFEEVL